jgi:carbonic anhydrase/acetyltransferase-like protein (isoleucine patch superfamily)
MATYGLGDRIPVVASSAFVAPGASLIGSVTLGENISVWFGATLRGDIEPICIGANSNVQDAVVMHTDPGFPLNVGAFVTIGHQAILHGCTVHDGALIGIQAVVLTGAIIGRDCLVGAGAVVTERKVFPDRSLILGAPARVVRELADHEILNMHKGSHSYVERGADYRSRLRLVGC